MTIDQTDALIGLGLTIIAFLTAVLGWLRWLRPRIRSGAEQLTAARDSLIGRDPIVDPITGKELAPALPGIGARMAEVEHAVKDIATLIREQRDQDRRLDDHETRIHALEAAAIERVASKAESVAAWRAIEAVANTEPPEQIEGD